MRNRHRKILIIHNILWSHYKGIVFSELYKLCEKNNVDLMVLQIALNEKGRKTLGDLDTSIHKYPYKLLFEKSLEEITFIEKTTIFLREILYFKPDIIVIPGWNDPVYWIIEIFSKFLGKKLILQNDSTEFDRERVWYKEFIKKLLVKLVDIYWCYGRASKSYLKKLGAEEKRIFVRFQATDNKTISKIYREFKRNRQKLLREKGWKNKNFIYVGRLSPEKNIITLLEVFKQIKDVELRASDWGLIIVGDGTQRYEIEEYIKIHTLKDVYIVGGKSWKEVPQYYALADVFVLPSISEPWGLVVNEAMVCCLPIVVSKRAGAYYDLVNKGVNGFGFDPYNKKELKSILLKFIREEINIRSMGKASREIIKKYTPENAAKQMFAAIKYLMRRES